MNTLKKYLVLMITIFSLSGVFAPSNVEVFANNIPNITIDSSTNTIKEGLADSTKTGTNGILNRILTEYKGIIVFISGIAMLSMIMFFILNFIELGNSRGNPQARQKAINGLIISGVATAGLGSVTLIVQLFYNMIKE